VALVRILCSKGLGEYVGHGGRGKSHGEGPLGVVSGHRGDVQVFGDIDLHGLIRKGKDGGDLSHTVGSVVEHEQSVPLCRSARPMGRNLLLILESSDPEMMGLMNSSVTSLA
jgi:hypothetical protein